MLEYKQNIIKKNNFLCKSHFVPINYVIYEHFTANDLENKFLNSSFNIHGFHGILNLVKI